MLKQREAECWESYVDGLTQRSFSGYAEEGKGAHNLQAIAKVETLHTALSEEREAPTFVDIITKPCITLHRIALGKLLAWSTLPQSCSQPEEPACTSRLHMASLLRNPT